MELNSLKCSSAKDVAEIVKKALTFKGKLTNLGIEVDGTLIIGALIRALPQYFRSFLDYWTMMDTKAQTVQIRRETVGAGQIACRGGGVSAAYLPSSKLETLQQPREIATASKPPTSLAFATRLAT